MAVREAAMAYVGAIADRRREGVLSRADLEAFSFQCKPGGVTATALGCPRSKPPRTVAG